MANTRSSAGRLVSGSRSERWVPRDVPTADFQAAVLVAREERAPIRTQPPQAAWLELIRIIKTARRAAGNPPLAVLAAKLGYASASTMSRIFAGKARPTMRTLEKLAEELAVDQQTVTDVWAPLWQAAHDDVAMAPVVPKYTGPHDGFECHSCGSWVTNAVRHNEWHTKIEYDRHPAAPLRATG